MDRDNLQQQRFELKYKIRPETALAVRDFVSSYLDIDEYGATLANLSYPVHSLYLDSPDLKLYQSTINGDKNRFKLRLRFYESRPDAPVFFEIKRRTNNTISKMRGGVHRSAVGRILAGQLPDAATMMSKDPKHLFALQRFCQLMHALQARPRAHVAYLREAWISRRDNSIRVTMDRQIRCAPDATDRLTTEMFNPVDVFGTDVIFELKFTNRYPDWFRDLVRVFGLMQCGAAKYVDGVSLLGESALAQVPIALTDAGDGPHHGTSGRHSAALITAALTLGE